RTAGGHCADRSATRYLVGTGEAPASLAGRNFGLAPRRHTRGLNFRARRSTRIFLPASKRWRLWTIFSRLSERLEHWESRVSALERSPKAANSRPSPAAAPASATPAAEPIALPQEGGVFPVVGKAMLGIAGAYLLRALAESGSLPQLVVVALALAYAGMWLLWAARVPANTPFASVAYAVTSALILAPMLWELTLRFKV